MLILLIFALMDLDTAKAAALAKLENLPAYKTAISDFQAKEKILADARENGTAQEKLAASAAFNRARLSIEMMKAEAMNHDPDVIAAIREGKEEEVREIRRVEAERKKTDDAEAKKVKIVFVIDNNAAMINRLATIKEQILCAVRNMKPDVQFNVVACNDGKPTSAFSGLQISTDNTCGQLSRWLSDVLTDGESDPYEVLKVAVNMKATSIWFISDEADPTLAARIQGISSKRLKFNTVIDPVFPAESLLDLSRIFHGICIRDDGSIVNEKSFLPVKHIAGKSIFD